MIAALAPLMAEQKPDAVLVYGDTNSTLAGALTAAQANIAALVAADYWATRGCNEMADADKYDSITRTINGGLNGHEDRLRLMAEINNEWRTK